MSLVGNGMKVHSVCTLRRVVNGMIDRSMITHTGLQHTIYWIRRHIRWTIGTCDKATGHVDIPNQQVDDAPRHTGVHRVGRHSHSSPSRTGCRTVSHFHTINHDVTADLSSVHKLLSNPTDGCSRYCSNVLGPLGRVLLDVTLHHLETRPAFDTVDYVFALQREILDRRVVEHLRFPIHGIPDEGLS